MIVPRAEQRTIHTQRPGFEAPVIMIANEKEFLSFHFLSLRYVVFPYYYTDLLYRINKQIGFLFARTFCTISPFPTFPVKKGLSVFINADKVPLTFWKRVFC